MASPEKTRYSFTFMKMVGTGLALLGGGVAVAQFRLNDHAARVERLEAHEPEHVRMEEQVQQLRRDMEEVKGDVKELLRRGSP